MEKAILFNDRKPWSEKDTEYVINHFNHMSREFLIVNLGRSWVSIRTRYYTQHKRKKKEVIVDLTKCLNCGSKNVNQIKPAFQNTYYCLDCLLEYNKDGVIRPIWE